MSAREIAERFTRDVHRIVIGQDETVRLAFIALTLGGHLLIEGVPGTAKTLLALLEAMEEKQVTLEGEARMLPHPFLVIATQNPVEYEGTYPLPEAELDRFLFKAVVRYPEPSEEHAILRAHDKGQPLAQVATLEPLPARAIDEAAAEVDRVTVEDS